MRLATESINIDKLYHFKVDYFIKASLPLCQRELAYVACDIYLGTHLTGVLAGVGSGNDDTGVLQQGIPKRCRSSDKA